MNARRQRVEEVRPRSSDNIERVMEQLLRAAAPECLERPIPIPVEFIIDVALKQLFDFNFDVTDKLESGCDGETNFSDRIVGLSSSVYEQMEAHQGRARFTAAHEIAHVVLHSEELCRLGTRLIEVTPAVALKRAGQHAVPAYRDPEWQANQGASALLMPRSIVTALAATTKDPVGKLTAVLKVSQQAAEIRLKKLNLSNCN